MQVIATSGERFPFYTQIFNENVCVCSTSPMLTFLIGMKLRGLHNVKILSDRMFYPGDVVVRVIYYVSDDVYYIWYCPDWLMRVTFLAYCCCRRHFYRATMNVYGYPLWDWNVSCPVNVGQVMGNVYSF